MDLCPRPASDPRSERDGGWAPQAPLYSRVPARDETGRPLADFMMVLPGMKRQPRADLERALAGIREVLALYGDRVVFADYNLRLHVLWVSLHAGPGRVVEVAAAIHHRVPEARLVANRREAEVGAQRRR